MRRGPTCSPCTRYLRDFRESAYYDDPWKIIVSSRGNIELYDIRTDPAEDHDLSGLNPELRATMTEQLLEFDRALLPLFEESLPLIDEETLERLKALGYVR